jgi:hypothetical protein
MTRVAILVLLLVSNPFGSYPSATASGAGHEPRLREEIARHDQRLFDALFVACNAGAANAIYAPDVEFYDDRSGLAVGDAVREGSRRLAENCPADNGVRRILLEDTVEVHPLADYGAVQMGTHHFVEQGAAKTTVARFVHTWKRAGSEWKLARIISLHQTVDADEAARRRAE